MGADSNRARQVSGLVRWVLETAALVAVYYATARLGLSFGNLPGNVTPVWPPTGIAFAVLFLRGRRLWPGVFIGALLVNGLSSVPFAVAVTMAAGNTLEAVAGAWLVGRIRHFDASLERVRDAVAVLVLAGAGSTAISASIGVGALWTGGVIGPGAVLATWQTWWVGDALGLVLVGVALLVWSSPSAASASARLGSMAELACLVVALSVATETIFSGTTTHPYLLFPLLAWAGIRFGQRGAVTVNLAVASYAIWRTAAGRGPFGHGAPSNNLWTLDTFLAAASLMAVLLAATVAERDGAQAELLSVNDDLDATIRETTKDLRSDRRRLAEAQRLASLGSWEWNLTTDVLTMSDELYRIFDVDAAAFGGTFDAFLSLVHPDDRDAFHAAISRARAERGAFEFEHRVLTIRGNRIIQARGLVHVYERGQPVRMSGTALDVTERKHVEAVAARQAQQLSANERRLADAQEVGGLGSWEWDVATGSISWSDQMCRIYGHPPGLAPTFDEFVTMVHPSDRERVQRTISMALESRGVFQFDHRIVLPNGTERTLHARGGVDVDINGQPVTMRGTGQDVTEAKDSETALRHANSLLQELATTDTLTGLPNRALFSDRLDQALALGRREGRDVAVMFLDLDRFKDVNDSLGHDGGDELLVEVSRRLFGVLRDSDTVARLGGDEFGLLLSGPTTPEQAAFTAERVLECFRRSFTTGGREFFVSASIGIALWPEDCKSKAELLKHADVAMYRAKAAGGNRFEMFELAMTVAARDRLRVESELRQAIDHEELFLRYHPQIDLVTGDVVAVEGLVRWAHPSRGEVMPAEFISLAEDTGLIVPIGAWVLGEACRQAARWRREFADRPTLRMSVNVSARQLAHPGFVALVESALKESDMEPTDLELEITESVLIAESGPAVAALRSLRRLGVRLAIDDFGTGYSSLSYLRRFPVDRLKLDMSFVAGLSEANGPTQPGEGALVDAAINLGHALGLRALAEGVEDETQLRALIAYGCDEGQGYLWTKPLLAADLGAWLTARSAGLAAATAATALAAATAANALATVD